MSTSADDTLPVVSLILVGNPGGGKSFLSNVLLGTEAFAHEYRGRPVTVLHEQAEATIPIHGQMRRVIVHNVPGLIDSTNNETATESNIKEIETAFEAEGDHIIGFVFAVGAGGRLVPQDMATYEALKNAYDFKNTSVLFIFNMLRPDRADDFDAEVIAEARGGADWPVDKPFNSVCLEAVPVPAGEVRRHTNFSESNAALVPIKSRLMIALADVLPFRHVKKNDVVLPHKKEIKDLQEKLDKIVSKLNDASEDMKTAKAQNEATEKKYRELQDELKKNRDRPWWEVVLTFAVPVMLGAAGGGGPKTHN